VRVVRAKETQEAINNRGDHETVCQAKVRCNADHRTLPSTLYPALFALSSYGHARGEIKVVMVASEMPALPHMHTSSGVGLLSASARLIGRQVGDDLASKPATTNILPN
jgi:hypothetical protein